MTARRGLLALCGCAAVAQSHAAELGFYVGGSYGNATRQTDIAKYDDLAGQFYDAYRFTRATTTRTLDEKDSTFGFVAGYRLLPHLAFEGGYVDLGSTAYRAKNTGAFPPEFVPSPNLNLNLDSKASGIALSALGILPLTYRFEVYARGGIVFATNTVHVFAYNELGSDTQEGSKTSTNLLAGVGASMSFLEIYGLRLEYQRVFDAGDKFTGKGDIDMVTLGITVGF
jgi:OmpA-like transmembrane domain